MSIRGFFERTLPAVLHSTPASAQGSRRILSIVVEGFGAWSVQLGGGSSSVRRGDDASPDLLLIATPAVFAALLRGEADPGSMLLEGDASLFERLINLLSPPKAGLVELRASGEKQKEDKRW
jgi:hypothetical protein